MKKPEFTGYSLLPYWGFVPAALDISLRRLAGAIIGQAAADARQDDKAGKEARLWLLSADCLEMCEFVGQDHNAVRAWVDRGCPDWRKAEDRLPEKTKTSESEPFRP